MSTTLKLVQRTSKTRKDGTAPIWLRITANRKSTSKSTGVVVLPKHWDADRQLVRKSHSVSPALNRKLKEVLIAAQTSSLEVQTAAAVKIAMAGNVGSMTAYFESFIESLDHRNAPSTVRKEMQRLSRVCKVARVDGEIRVDQDPLMTYSLPKTSKPNRRKLSLEEIGQLEALDLEFGTSQRLARDVFIFAFYSGGMRFSDVSR